jgi:hypothetical protein
MLGSLARALHLSLDERDHLFRLAGHNIPERTLRANHINPGLMRIIDRLADTPAQIMGGLGETLLQTPLATALLGDETRFTGMARSVAYRWFTDPDARTIYPPEDHDTFSPILPTRPPCIRRCVIRPPARAVIQRAVTIRRSPR